MANSGVSMGDGGHGPRIWACRRFPLPLFIHSAYNVPYILRGYLLHRSCKLTTVKLLLTYTSSLCPPHFVGPKIALPHFLSAGNATDAQRY